MEYTQTPPSNLKLDSLCLGYSTGRKYKIVDLGIAAQKKIIHDKYFEINKAHDISILFYPDTLVSIIYFGIFDMDDYEKYRPLSKLFDTRIRRQEVRIITLRDSLVMYPDALYMVATNLLPERREPFNLKNDQLIYGIIYSSNGENRKTSMIVGKNRGSFSKSGYKKYFEVMGDEVKERDGIVVPCYRSVWEKNFPESRVVVI